MPRGGHKAGFWPQGIGSPKDIFRPRWKHFYKALYRYRSRGFNEIDAAHPHRVTDSQYPDGLPQPWRLQLLEENAPSEISKRTRNTNAFMIYDREVKDFLKPFESCKAGPKYLDLILRSLDPGRRGTHSGIGTLMLGSGRGNMRGWKDRGNGDAELPFPQHIRECIMPSDDGEQPLDENTFFVRRLYELLARREMNKGNTAKIVSNASKFPYVDENASLVDDLHVDSILRVRHRINSRRMPRRKARADERKKGKKKWLRIKAILEDEKQIWAENAKRALVASSAAS